jgi:predicted acyl esterase
MTATAGTRRDEWITMSDGIRLAVTLYLPDAALGPQPCILEALPYRKDDMTSSYRPEYVRLRDEHAYAVARLDLRGTGSSGGIATDEYPAQEQRDLHEVITWLADQPWCDGNIGMYGTSYSGFNSLQMACERPENLRAVIAIYATDDRYTDDVHYMGGALRWLDLIDYCHYMTPMNALPPVPQVWGDGWREEWLHRIDALEPWLHTWLEHPRDDDYWRHGSVRPDHARIECPVLIVAGWADGYRNATFRLLEALAAQGTPAHLLAGPWSHASTATSAPGPRIDLVPEMAAWWDRWLRGRDTGAASAAVHPAANARWFTRDSHAPAADLDIVPGIWRRDCWPSSRVSTRTHAISALGTLAVRPNVGVAAWNSCAGHLPWGQPTDQRYDDAASLRWDLPIDAEALEIVGHARVRLRVTPSAAFGHVAVRLCDVAPDGTSTLVTRGLLDLTARTAMSATDDVVADTAIDVVVELEATAWRFLPGRTLRLSIAGTDWPNTVAPPGPLSLDVHGGALDLPVYTPDPGVPSPAFAPGDARSSESADGVTWHTVRDVLRDLTTCIVEHGSTYDTPYGSATERYRGHVLVDGHTFAQEAYSHVTFTMHFDGHAPITTDATLRVTTEGRDYAVETVLTCSEGATIVRHREWSRRFPRAGGVR